MEDRLLTLEQVKDRLNIHYNTLYRYIQQGMIPVVVITRNKRYIKEQDLEEFIKRHTGTYRQEEEGERK